MRSTSAIRSSVVRMLAAAWLVSLVLCATAAAQSTNDVVVGEIKGVINPAMASYVDRVISDAERADARAVVFTMNTPGGLADATHDINLRILSARVPVIVYVVPDGARAGSAGVSIVHAAHLAAMAPTSSIGSLAEREDASVPASEALSAADVKYVATDLRDLLRQVDGTSVNLASGPVTLETADAPVSTARPSPFESFLLAITNPTVAYLLLSLGCLGLMLELYHPGSIVPGAIGLTCVLLAFYALGTLPLNFTGVALLVFGLVLFGLEPLVPSHGILAVGGAIAFAAGSLLLINAPDAPFLQISVGAIAAVTGVLLVFALVVVAALMRARRRQVVTGREGLIGAAGVVRREVQPDAPGLVLTQGELWQAVGADGRLAVGEPVIVEGIDGLQLRVRRAPGIRPAARRPASPAAAKSEAARS